MLLTTYIIKSLKRNWYNNIVQSITYIQIKFVVYYVQYLNHILFRYTMKGLSDVFYSKKCI